MQPQNYISDFDALKKWFELQNCVKFGLYRGFHDRMPERSVIYKQRDEQLSAEESWAVLQDLIEVNGTGGGKFTIFLPTFGAAKGVSVFFGYHLSPVGLAPGVHGHSLRGHGAAVGMVPENDIERRINDALEKERMARKIEDLEASIGQKSSFQDVLFEKLLQLDPDKIMDTLGGLLARAIPQPVQMPVTMRGIHEQPQPAPLPAEDQEEGETGFHYDGERLMPALDAMCAHFDSPDDFVTFLEKVAVKFCDQPDFFKSYIQ